MSNPISFNPATVMPCKLECMTPNLRRFVVTAVKPSYVHTLDESSDIAEITAEIDFEQIKPTKDWRGMMLFYIQMRWNVEGRLNNEELWALEATEGEYAKNAVEMGLVKSIYKVAGQRRVIAVVDLPDAESLDRTIMAGLPMAQYLEFEAIWPLREYAPFIEECRRGFKETQNS